jgi:hypothetical protein
MDHEQAIRQKATERYLLDELEPAVREEFEEHLFDCPDCALDVRTAAAFIEQSKVVLAEKSAAVQVSAPVAAKPAWLAWFRPAWAVPVFALLVIVIGYQGFSYRRLEQAANTPQVLPFASINVGTRGSGVTQVPVQPGQSFQLLVNIPPDSRYVCYRLDLYSSQEKLEWSRTIPAASADDTRSLYVPGTARQAGSLALAVHGITAAGESVDLGRYPIEFQAHN